MIAETFTVSVQQVNPHLFPALASSLGEMVEVEEGVGMETRRDVLLGGAPKMCITFVTGWRLHTSLERELLGSNGKTHQIWNGQLLPVPRQLLPVPNPMSFSIRPQ